MWRRRWRASGESTMASKPPRDDLILDDRGDVRSPYDLGALVRADSERGMLSDDEMRELRRKARGGWLWVAWLNLPAVIGLAIFATLFVMYTRTPTWLGVTSQSLCLASIAGSL